MNYETHNTPADQRAKPVTPRDARPREPRPGMAPEQVEHAEFILSTRETRLELVRA